MWEEEAADLEDELGGGVLAAAGLEQLGRVRAAKREKQRRQQVGYPAGKQAEAAEQPLVAMHLEAREAAPATGGVPCRNRRKQLSSHLLPCT